MNSRTTRVGSSLYEEIVKFEIPNYRRFFIENFRMYLMILTLSNNFLVNILLLLVSNFTLSGESDIL